MVVFDEIYEKIIYDDVEYLSIGVVNLEIFKNIIISNGFVKVYFMIGWWIGYLVVFVELINVIVKI